jgi:hypothetical protein
MVVPEPSILEGIFNQGIQQQLSMATTTNNCNSKQKE